MTHFECNGCSNVHNNFGQFLKDLCCRFVESLIKSPVYPKFVDFVHSCDRAVIVLSSGVH